MAPLCCQSTFAHQQNRAHTPHILTQSLADRPHVGKPVGTKSAGCSHPYAEQLQTKTLLPPLLQQPTRQLCCNTATAARRLHHCSLRPTAYLQLAIHKGYLETFIPGQSYSPWQRQALPDHAHATRLRGQQRHCSSSALPCTHPLLLLTRKVRSGFMLSQQPAPARWLLLWQTRQPCQLRRGWPEASSFQLQGAKPHDSITAQHSTAEGRVSTHALQSSVSPCPLNSWRHARAY